MHLKFVYFMFAWQFLPIKKSHNSTDFICFKFILSNAHEKSKNCILKSFWKNYHHAISDLLVSWSIYAICILLVFEWVRISAVDIAFYLLFFILYRLISEIELKTYLASDLNSIQKTSRRKAHGAIKLLK